jgi:hypothetical protein
MQRSVRELLTAVANDDGTFSIRDLGSTLKTRFLEGDKRSPSLRPNVVTPLTSGQQLLLGGELKSIVSDPRCRFVVEVRPTEEYRESPAWEKSIAREGRTKPSSRLAGTQKRSDSAPKLRASELFATGGSARSLMAQPKSLRGGDLEVRRSTALAIETGRPL